MAALVEPAVADTACAALRRDSTVISWRGNGPLWASRSITSCPQRNAAAGLSGCTAGMSFDPNGDTPRKDSTMAMVLAVNWPPQAPAPGQAAFSIAARAWSSMLPAECTPTASNTSWMVTALPSHWPGMIVPPYRITPGTSSRARAIAAAGMVLSQPHSSTTPSRQWPLTANSIESAITSREASEARMPLLPMAMPSVMAMVLNSTGVPP